jgi:hypothetical protein
MITSPIRCGPVTKRFGGPTWATGNLDRSDQWRADQRRDLVDFCTAKPNQLTQRTGRRRNGPSVRHRPTERVLMSHEPCCPSGDISPGLNF